MEVDIISSESELHFEAELEVPTQLFYVCFSGCGDYPGSSWVKRGFNHVSVMEKLPFGFIVHDPNKYALDTYILPGVETEDFISKFIEQRPDYTIVEVTKKASSRARRFIRFGFQSCVSIVAYILGIKLPWYCGTPYELYKQITRGGYGIINTRRL